MAAAIYHHSTKSKSYSLALSVPSSARVSKCSSVRLIPILSDFIHMYMYWHDRNLTHISFLLHLIYCENRQL